MRRTLIVLLVLLVGFGIWQQQDEPLSDAARDWRQDTHQPNQAFALLAGMGAAEDADPIATGRQQLAALQKGENPPYPDTLASASHPLLCDYDQSDCLHRQQQQADDARTLLTKHRTLLERYQAFLALDDFAGISQPRIDSPFPPYERLMGGARLQHLQWALEPDAAAMAEQRQALRALLARPHTLISKLTTAAILDQQLQLTALLVQQGRLANPMPAPLDREQQAFIASLKAEFRLTSSLFFEMKRDAWDDPQITVPEAMMASLGLKPQMTVNRLQRYYQHYADLSRQPGNDWFDQDTVLPEPSWSQRLRNPMGLFLLNIAGADMRRYMARLVNLDAQLRLFHWLDGKTPDPAYHNPWPAPHDPKPRQRDKQLCFASPFDDIKLQPCLPRPPSDQSDTPSRTGQA